MSVHSMNLTLHRPHITLPGLRVGEGRKGRGIVAITLVAVVSTMDRVHMGVVAVRK